MFTARRSKDAIPELGSTEQLLEAHPEAGPPPYEYRWVDGIQGGVLTLDHGLTHASTNASSITSV